MKITKKLITLALAALMLLSLAVPAMAADSDFEIGTMEYADGSVNENMVLGYTGPGGDVVIPGGVAGIGNEAFKNNTSLKSVTIPTSVEAIGWNVFEGCTSLTSVSIPSNVTFIGGSAFAGCTSLASVIIPEGLTMICNGTFDGCTSLKSVTIPAKVEIISPDAFKGCTGLESVIITSGDTFILGDAFNACPSLTDVYFGGTREQWEVIEKENSDWKMRPIFGDGAYPTIHFNSTGPETPTPPAAPSFGDVPANAWFAAPVAWAVEQGITNGTGANRFSPNKTCNNSEILTFLWRACGKPEAPAANFTDVVSGAWYADAANWAKSMGMVSGDKLSPTEPCTRASAVMFIWQAMGKPAASKAASFTDVSANADYAAAVAWAVEKGVTNGTGADTFSPDSVCTRAQIVAFLQRAYAE